MKQTSDVFEDIFLGNMHSEFFKDSVKEVAVYDLSLSKLLKEDNKELLLLLKGIEDDNNRNAIMDKLKSNKDISEKKDEESSNALKDIKGKDGRKKSIKKKKSKKNRK